jgi:hypothetical protein
MNIEKLAHKAGIDVSNNKSSEVWVSDLQEFANFVREATLEEAAKRCDDYAAKCAANENWEAEDVSLINAAAIRGLK